jgi:hypothetical protein
MLNSLIDFKSLDKSNIVKPTHKKKKSIKNISSVNKTEISSKDIVRSLQLKFISHKYQINNAFIYDWESDFFSISELDYVYEVEIKVTKGDFKDDFNKVAKHVLLESQDPEVNLKRPNKFFYAAPKNLLATSIIPPYAGFIEINPEDGIAHIVRDAPYLHKEKSLQRLKDILLDKFYSRYREMLLEK